jgi:hypothetical protein
MTRENLTELMLKLKVQQLQAGLAVLKKSNTRPRAPPILQMNDTHRRIHNHRGSGKLTACRA